MFRSEQYILSFQSKNGNARILITIVAFGMEVNCKGLNYVIHYGQKDDKLWARKGTP